MRELDVPHLLDRAREQLEAADPPPDAIVGYWDFPVSSMVPILCRERGLASASLEPGDRLSELVLQEPFSHELAQVFVAVADAEELVTTYRRAVEAMGIVVDHDRRR